MSINNVVAFEDWNSSNRAWNTGTWNGDVTFDLTSTGSVGASTVTGDANVTVTGFGTTASLGSYFTTNTQSAMTTSINSATITGDANVTVTGVSGTASVDSSAVGTTGDASVTVTGLAGTSSLGTFFTTSATLEMVALVNSTLINTTQSCQVSPTGLSATGQIGEGTGEIFATWGQIIPIQTPSYSAITPSQSPSFSAVSPSQSPSWTDLAA
jgi:hypothetical protein